MQKTCIAKEAIEGKLAFEKFCRQQGGKVRGYHAGNGVFKASKWVSDQVEASRSYLRRYKRPPYQW